MTTSQPPRIGLPASRFFLTKSQYLVIYNAVSLLLWVSLLGRILLVLTLVPSFIFSNGGPLSAVRHVYPSNGNFAKWIQTLAVAEVLHSLFGLVRAPATTTGMQVASRLLLVWGIVGMFGGEGLLEAKGAMGDVVGKVKRATGGHEVQRSNQVAYLGMLVAWAVTECVRYAYFVILLSSGAIPKWLSWLRYNTFFVLYPLGISCECWLIYKSIPFAGQWDVRYEYFLKAVLLTYIPGSYILFTHMMTQRRRVMRGKERERG